MSPRGDLRGSVNPNHSLGTSGGRGHESEEAGRVASRNRKMLSPDHGVFKPMCQNTISRYPDSSGVDTHGSTDRPDRASFLVLECQHDHHRPRTCFQGERTKASSEQTVADVGDSHGHLFSH